MRPGAKGAENRRLLPRANRRARSSLVGLRGDAPINPARIDAGDDAGALETARQVVRLSPTLEHQCLLAERLIAEGLTDEAWHSLEQALESHRHAPGPSRRRNRTWAKRARRLQKEIDGQA